MLEDIRRIDDASQQETIDPIYSNVLGVDVSFHLILGRDEDGPDFLIVDEPLKDLLVAEIFSPVESNDYFVEVGSNAGEGKLDVALTDIDLVEGGLPIVLVVILVNDHFNLLVLVFRVSEIHNLVAS